MGIPNYLRNVPFLSLGMAEYTSANWVKDWTLMYWSWWIAWTPFVSTFVALISKGRTIREVMYGVLVGPTLFILVWFVVFGDAAITLQIKQAFFGANLDLDKVNLVFFQMLNKLAGSQILSADSATYTLASLSNEDLEHAPPKVLQFGWGLMFTVLATLFLLTGGIHALIKVTLISVLPFGIWLVFVFYALIVKLISYYKEEFLTDGEPIPQPIRTKLKIKTTVVSPIYSPIRSTYGIDYK
jgi:glycine betaine transporter